MIVAKLDQRNRRIEIDSALSRDFHPEEIQTMINTLEQWLEASEDTAVCIKKLIDKANATKAENVRLREATVTKANIEMVSQLPILILKLPL